jgi:DNA-binding response OmpR family regulator
VSRKPTTTESPTETQRVRRIAYGSSLPLLLIEDDELARERLEVLLTAAEFDVYPVASVSEAREMSRAMVFPVVVIDRGLGQDDGMQLVTELRARYAPHRVFLMLLTARDSERDKLEGMSLGADLYLSKRICDEQLLASLHEARDSVRLKSK